MSSSLVARIKRLYKYVVNYFFRWKPTIFTPEQTIDLITRKRLSIARLGDGELKMIGAGNDIHFQDTSVNLVVDLRRCLATRNDKLLICLPGALRLESKPYKRDIKRFYRWQYGLYYPLYYRFFERGYSYGDTNISRFYMDFKKPKKRSIELYIEKLKKVWDGRNVLVVEGYDTKLGAMTDLLDNCFSVRRIICPNRNAYSVLDAIAKAVVNHYHEGDLILLCLGPSATILATDLTVERGFQCLDIGHIDVEYVWFLHGAADKARIQGMNSAEALEEAPLIQHKYDEEKYKKQIIMRIDNRGL